MRIANTSFKIYYIFSIQQQQQQQQQQKSYKKDVRIKRISQSQILLFEVKILLYVKEIILENLHKNKS